MAEESKTATLKVAAFSGSLRKGSTNTGLLRAAKELAPEGVEVTIVSIADLPLLNEDDIVDNTAPEAVMKFRAALREANAYLLACPEYNYSMSAAFKNALDWASKPLSDGGPPMQGRGVAVIGSGGGAGALRAQYAFRQTAVFMQLNVMTAPETGIRRWGGAFFNDAGDLVDDGQREKVSKLVAALGEYGRKFL